MSLAKVEFHSDVSYMALGTSVHSRGVNQRLQCNGRANVRLNDNHRLARAKSASSLGLSTALHLLTEVGQ